ncbi:CLUMA_CG009148, isoform A [Clunio marinus]|uniref:CLUMA_CG009148, isoform A n=1 Tax=Clunio marinus TaxID=568069 RepID=A0A1J1I7H1_9DIPT|nr:CLUMA_CG009148, isoform A [Clunio marinus]
MWIFRVLFLFPVLTQSLRGDVPLTDNQINCTRNFKNACIIEAVFGNSQTNDTVDVFVSCSDDNELSYNQFSKIDKIIWNGCYASGNLKGLGLQKIPKKNEVKYLKIQRFAIGILEAGTFDGFFGLEVLVIQSNAIQNLSSSCFRGLKSLRTLEIVENSLKWIDEGTFADFPKLNVLDIRDIQHLLMASHQFMKNQIIDNVKLEIYYMEMDLLEHLFLHVQNLSISLSLHGNSSDVTQDCQQTRLNGFEKGWIVESLSVANLRCGLILENIKTLKNLKLVRVIDTINYEFELKDLPQLELLSMHKNILKNLSASLKFKGDLRNLKSFELSNNTMTEIDMRIFETFTNLKEINLCGNFLRKFLEMKLEDNKFEKLKIFVDGNNFDCAWLYTIASSKAFESFVFKKNFEGLNIDGLSCMLNVLSINESVSYTPLVDVSNVKVQNKLSEMHEENFILTPEMLMIIMSISVLLGTALTFISIYTYHKYRILNQKPFYHLLRDSLQRPMCDVQRTLRRNLKEVISRNLPPTNYEHPISDSNVTEMTDVETNTSNIYEEIPQLPY